MIPRAFSLVLLVAGLAAFAVSCGGEEDWPLAADDPNAARATMQHCATIDASIASEFNIEIVAFDGCADPLWTASAQAQLRTALNDFRRTLGTGKYDFYFKAGVKIKVGVAATVSEYVPPDRIWLSPSSFASAAKFQGAVVHEWGHALLYLSGQENALIGKFAVDLGWRKTTTVRRCFAVWCWDQDVTTDTNPKTGPTAYARGEITPVGPGEDAMESFMCSIYPALALYPLTSSRSAWVTYFLGRLSSSISTTTTSTSTSSANPTPVRCALPQQPCSDFGVGLSCTAVNAQGCCGSGRLCNSGNNNTPQCC